MTLSDRDCPRIKSARCSFHLLESVLIFFKEGIGKEGLGGRALRLRKPLNRENGATQTEWTWDFNMLG